MCEYCTPITWNMFAHVWGSGASGMPPNAAGADFGERNASKRVSGKTGFSVKRGGGIQSMRALVWISTEKAIQWRGPGHFSVNRWALKTERLLSSSHSRKSTLLEGKLHHTLIPQGEQLTVAWFHVMEMWVKTETPCNKCLSSCATYWNYWVGWKWFNDVLHLHLCRQFAPNIVARDHNQHPQG